MGRLFGIQIRVDWSWLLIFFLITWNLATSFAQIHPNWAMALTWSLALAALLFFAAVLAHELAHALVTKAQNIPVRNITLFLFGGVAMIFGTRLPFFGTGVVSGVWLAVIGWFLSNAAIQSYQQLVIHDLFEGVPVTRLMRTNVPAVAPTMSIGALVDNYILHSDERAFPVLEGDRAVGLVTLDDVRKVARGVWDTTTVGDILTPAEHLAVVSPQQDAAAALDKLIQRDVRQLPVMLDGHVTGMVRRRDIVRWLQLRSGAVAS